VGFFGKAGLLAEAGSLGLGGTFGGTLAASSSFLTGSEGFSFVNVPCLPRVARGGWCGSTAGVTLSDPVGDDLLEGPDCWLILAVTSSERLLSCWIVDSSGCGGCRGLQGALLIRGLFMLGLNRTCKDSMGAVLDFCVC